MHEVLDFDLVGEDGDVGDEAAVATPPHTLTAHHRRSLPTRLLHQLGEGVSELGRAGIRRVRSELVDLPPGILPLLSGRQAPAPAQPRLVAVVDSHVR